MKFSHKIAKIAKIDSFALFVISLNSGVFRERSKYEETCGGRHSQDEREEARVSPCGFTWPLLEAGSVARGRTGSKGCSPPPFRPSSSGRRRKLLLRGRSVSSPDFPAAQPRWLASSASSSSSLYFLLFPLSSPSPRRRDRAYLSALSWSPEFPVCIYMLYAGHARVQRHAVPPSPSRL